MHPDFSRAALLRLWTEAWGGDVWVAPWSRAVADLYADQAAWVPAPGRHSIWQNVNHVIFWRNYTLRVLAGQPKPSDAEVETGNSAAPSRIDEAAWGQARTTLADSHESIRTAMSAPSNSLDRLQYHLMPDA